MEAKNRFVVMACGRGSGKTFAASLLIAKRLLCGERLMVFAQNYASLTENMFTEVRKRLDTIIGYDKYIYNKGNKKLEVPFSGRYLVWTNIREHRSMPWLY